MAKSNSEEQSNKQPEKRPSLREAIFDIPAKNAQIEQISRLQDENKTLRDAISERRKSTRGPSSAGRIQGLQTLKNTLGTQFYKKTED